MREKNLVILCILFAVLVSLVFLKKSIKPQVPTSEEITDIISPAINSDNINKISLRLGDGINSDTEKPKNVRLVKEEDIWVVETHYGVRARDTSITPLLEQFDQLKGELRSDRENLLDDYGISDQEGIHVELQRPESAMIHIIVGTQNAGFQNNFVRHNGSSAVYIVNENLLSTLGVRGEGDDQKLDSNKWVDKRIAHTKANEVVGVTFTESDSSGQKKIIDLKRELVDDKRKWQSSMPYSFGLSAAKIKSVIELFNNTYASEIIAPDAEGAFDAPGWSANFSLENDNQISFMRGMKDETGSNYYVKREGAEHVYLVPISTFHSRVNQQGAIFANNPLKAEEKNVKGVEIRDLETKKVFSATKKEVPPASDALEPEETNADLPDEKDEDVWETPEGEIVEIAKVRSAINAIKNIGLEIVTKPAQSLKNIMTIQLSKENDTREINISEVYKSETNKECHFLSIIGDTQSYCMPKSSMTPLQNALP